MSDLCNTNRLRISVNDARKFNGPTGFGRYYSGDHDKPRLETNWWLRIGWLSLDVKWRPDGKRRQP